MILGVSPSGVVSTRNPTRLFGTVSMVNPSFLLPSTTFEFVWTCLSAVDLFGNATACPDLSDYANTVMSLPNSNNLVIAPGILVPGSTYIFRLTANSLHPTGTGFGQVSVTMNQPPTGGSFAVTPLNAVQFRDIITMLQAGWIDPEGGSLLFNVVTSSYSNLTSYNFLLAQAQDGYAFYSRNLPVGIIHLSLFVYDDTGDKTITAAVAVNISSNITLSSVASQKISQATQTNDPSWILQTVNAIGQLLAFEQSNNLAAVRMVRFELANAVIQAASLQYLSSENINALIASLAIVAQNPSELSQVN